MAGMCECECMHAHMCLSVCIPYESTYPVAFLCVILSVHASICLSESYQILLGHLLQRLCLCLFLRVFN